MASGILNLLKPPGMTSRQAVSRVSRLTGEKAGHAGTLDPQACGVLPILLGKATRLFDFVASERKQYLAEICFGMETDTQDAQGVSTSQGGRVPAGDEVKAVLPKFIGHAFQSPPSYSAKKVGGVRAHRLARLGDAPELAPQEITVYGMTYLAQTADDRHLLRIVCSKGTYIRTLCQDMGRALDALAHMSFLLREATGNFLIGNAVTLEELEEALSAGVPESQWLMPLDQVLSQVPTFCVAAEWETACLNGVALPFSAGTPAPSGPGQQLRVVCRGALVGLGITSGNDIRVKTWLLESERI